MSEWQPMKDLTEKLWVEIENEFMDAVWSILKSDCSDLRKQQKILKAFRRTRREGE